MARDSAKKKAMKGYADSKRKATQHNITVGQSVLITNNKPTRDKYTPRWLPIPGRVTAVKGNSISIDHQNKNIMRSSAQVKPYFTNNAVVTNPLESHVLSNSSESDSDVIDQDDRLSSTSDANTESTIPYDNDIDIPDDADGEVMFQPLPTREMRPRRQPAHLQDYVCHSK